MLEFKNKIISVSDTKAINSHGVIKVYTESLNILPSTLAPGKDGEETHIQLMVNAISGLECSVKENNVEGAFLNIDELVTKSNKQFLSYKEQADIIIQAYQDMFFDEKDIYDRKPMIIEVALHDNSDASLKRIVKSKLKAILCASGHSSIHRNKVKYGPISIMLRDVTSPDQVVELKRLIRDCCNELKREGYRPDNNMQVGVMFNQLLDEAEIKSIGHHANYFAIGNIKDNVDFLYEPSNLKSLGCIVKQLASTGKKVIYSGDISPSQFPLLIGMGLTCISLDADRVADSRFNLRRMSLEDAQKIYEVSIGKEGKSQLKKDLFLDYQQTLLNAQFWAETGLYDARDRAALQTVDQITELNNKAFEYMDFILNLKVLYNADRSAFFREYATRIFNAFGVFLHVQPKSFEHALLVALDLAEKKILDVSNISVYELINNKSVKWIRNIVVGDKDPEKDISRYYIEKVGDNKVRLLNMYVDELGNTVPKIVTTDILIEKDTHRMYVELLNDVRDNSVRKLYISGGYNPSIAITEDSIYSQIFGYMNDPVFDGGEDFSLVIKNINGTSRALYSNSLNPGSVEKLERGLHTSKYDKLKDIYYDRLVKTDSRDEVEYLVNIFNQVRRFLFAEKEFISIHRDPARQFIMMATNFDNYCDIFSDAINNGWRIEFTKDGNCHIHKGDGIMTIKRMDHNKCMHKARILGALRIRDLTNRIIEKNMQEVKDKHIKELIKESEMFHGAGPIITRKLSDGSDVEMVFNTAPAYIKKDDDGYRYATQINIRFNKPYAGSIDDFLAPVFIYDCVSHETVLFDPKMKGMDVFKPEIILNSDFSKDKRTLSLILDLDIFSNDGEFLFRIASGVKSTLPFVNNGQVVEAAKVPSFIVSSDGSNLIEHTDMMLAEFMHEVYANRYEKQPWKKDDLKAFLKDDRRQYNLGVILNSLIIPNQAYEIHKIISDLVCNFIKNQDDKDYAISIILKKLNECRLSHNIHSNKIKERVFLCLYDEISHMEL